ncbi:cobalamin biosynthesis protein [Oscillatoria sp. FACHB-1407]|uniref:adenosylcobinamide-phosphate synthase CbiB n=1 Tax=Oscillatoria sp. FACHB-1407 TaxID=2692847 RepID=UPI001684F13A|nr:adenosylcobinamide-phosphate synthase CbiB [Oscillatoria sp. FACHB-1407]MBD2460043.1 cobalamin biosynthesis protein [Oscillatoria sp. FACHB-1407]
MPIESSAIVLAIASFLDYLIGDPWNWLHPVQVMGWVIGGYSKWMLGRFSGATVRRVAGVVLGIGMMGGSGLVGWLMVWVANRIHPVMGMAIASVMLASCFAGRSLRRAAEDVLQPLSSESGASEESLVVARSRLSRYVGRDTEHLSRDEILRAVLETVTENAVDGVMAPLFYAIVGALLPIGSVPLALAYKAASTLDSMVGYKEAPYTDLGWFSARTEDVLTWLPCRLTVLSLVLVSGNPGRVWQVCCRDAPQDPSPNAGWSECAYAAVLGVQVGGTNTYRGVTKHKPLLGDALRPITVERIERAMGLTRTMFIGWVAIALGLMVVEKGILPL